MLSESTSLAGFIFLLVDALDEEYGIDAAPLLAECGIDPELRGNPGSRIDNDTAERFAILAMDRCGDSTLGIKVGQRATYITYYVLGYAWHASSNLKEAIERLIRYGAVIDTAQVEVEFEKIGDAYRLSATYPDGDELAQAFETEVGVAGLFQLCESVVGHPVLPVRVEWVPDSTPHPDAHDALFGVPVEYGANEYAFWFSAEDIEAPLDSSIPEIATASDAVAERYIASFDKSQVATQVRQLLIQMLPSGRADQESIASKLYRSSSTLQRQLSAEGTSYRDILETTRRTLAQNYLRDGEHTHSQIAFLLGFSDQSNFSRAFKRWTGKSPGQYQKEEVA